MKLHTLGTGPASGWPSYGSEKRKVRRPSTYLVECNGDAVFLDTGSIEAVIEGVRRVKEIRAVLLSHAHADHWSGINNLRWGPQTPVFLSKETLEHRYFSEIREAPFSLELTPVRVFEEVEVGEFKVTPFPLLHIEGTIGFLVRCKDSSLAYALDTKGLPKESLKFLVSNGVDYLVIDSSLRPGEEGNHNNYLEAIKLAKEIGARVTFLVHLLPHLEENEVVEAANNEGVLVKIPEDGEVFHLP